MLGGSEIIDLDLVDATKAMRRVPKDGAPR